MAIDPTDPFELVSSFVQVLGYQINGANALTEQLHDQSFFDNADTWYSGSPNDQIINATVARYEADPAAARYLKHWYEPTGEIDDPVVTLHTTRDPLVPPRNEAIYANRVEAAGNEALLHRLAPVDEFGHCAFDAGDIVGAFLKLRAEVTGGS